MEQKVQSNKKKKLNNILLVVECIVIVFCIIFSIIVISQPGEVGENRKKATFLPVQTDSMAPTIPVGALVITQDASEDTYDLGTIVTFTRHSTYGNYLDTHRIVGYKYFVKSENTFKIEYYKKGVMETEADFLEKYASEGYTIYSYVTRGDKYTDTYGDWDDFSKTKPEVIGTKFGDGEDADIINSVEMFNDPDQFHSNIVCIYKTHVNGIGAVLTWFMQPTHFFIVVLIPLILLFLYNAYGVVKIIIQLKVKKAKEETKLDEEEIKRRAIEEYLKSQNTAESAELSAEEPKAETSTDEVKEETSTEGTEGSGE